ncbi:MAG: hypothetical protein ABIA91_01425 [Patescibacteria group bacterium]
METRNLIHCYLDGNQWCAIYPMGSDLMSCKAVEFAPRNIIYNEQIRRSRDYGMLKAINKLRTNNPEIQTSFYTEHWD